MLKTADNPNIKYQPKVQGYSYSSSDPVPKSQSPINPKSEKSSTNQNSRKSLNTILTLVFSILGFLFLFFVLLAVLNNFNIISLNKISPQLFGWIPKITVDIRTEKQKLQDTVKKDNTFFNSALLDEQSGLWNVKGLVLSFDSQDLKLITAQGEKNFKLDKDSSINVPASSTAEEASDSGTLGFIQLSPKDYSANLSRGRVLNVYYEITSQTENLVKEAYLEEN